MTHTLTVIGILLALAFGPLVCVPVAPLLIAAGSILGLKGLWLVMLALTVDIVLGYFIAARWLRGLVERFLKKAKVPTIPAGSSWQVIALVRAMPGLPLTVQNYFLGFTRVPFWPYLIISLPIQLAWAVGFMVSGHALISGQWAWLVTGVALILLVAVLTRLYARNRK